MLMVKTRKKNIETDEQDQDPSEDTENKQVHNTLELFEFLK